MPPPNTCFANTGNRVVSGASAAPEQARNVEGNRIQRERVAQMPVVLHHLGDQRLTGRHCQRHPDAQQQRRPGDLPTQHGGTIDIAPRLVCTAARWPSLNSPA